MGKIFVIVGWPYAGTDLAAEYLVASYEAVRWGHSDRIREYAAQQGIEVIDTVQLSALFAERAAQEGYDWIAQIVAERVRALHKKDKKRPAVITGVRFLEEVEVYQALPGFQLVKIEADFPVRYRRACARQRLGERGLTPRRFRAIDALPGNAGIAELMALPGSVIVNNGHTKISFHRALDALVVGRK